VRIGVYNRYWSTLGGGERYAGTLVEAIKDEAEVDLIGIEPMDVGELGTRLEVDLRGTRFVSWPPLDCLSLVPFTRSYDVLINATYGSPMRSEAKRSAYVVLFPHQLQSRRSALLGGTARAVVRALAPWRVRIVGGHYGIQGDGTCWTSPHAWLRLTPTAFREGVATVHLRPGPWHTRVLSVEGPVDSWSLSGDALRLVARDVPLRPVELRVSAETPSSEVPGSVGRPLGLCLDFGAEGHRLRLIGRSAGTTHTDRDFLRDYATLLAISEYSRSWVRRRWGRDALLLPPPVDESRFSAAGIGGKRRVVLSVGRFFAASHHNKKHLEMVRAFRSMCDAGLVPDGWEYRLAGRVHRESAEHVAYFEEVRRLAEGYPIRILADLPYEKLVEEYRGATVFWHAAGWGEDDEEHPERFEHFGITTCEAMSAGCIPVVIAKAGQNEIVSDGVDGFTFLTEEELARKTAAVMASFGTDRHAALAEAARGSVGRYSRRAFIDRARTAILGP